MPKNIITIVVRNLTGGSRVSVVSFSIVMPFNFLYSPRFKFHIKGLVYKYFRADFCSSKLFLIQSSGANRDLLNHD